MFFWKSSEGGGRGGSFPIQKITLQILLVSKRYILERKKRNVINQIFEEKNQIFDEKNYIPRKMLYLWKNVEFVELFRILENFHFFNFSSGITFATLIDIKDDCCTDIFSGNGNSKV